MRQPQKRVHMRAGRGRWESRAQAGQSIRTNLILDEVEDGLGELIDELVVELVLRVPVSEAGRAKTSAQGLAIDSMIPLHCSSI